MTVFTAEGMLRGWVRFNERGIGPSFVAATAGAYLRSLTTQGDKPKPEVPMWDPGWLTMHRELFSRASQSRDPTKRWRAFVTRRRTLPR
jgi:hypothetical protein